MEVGESSPNEPVPERPSLLRVLAALVAAQPLFPRFQGRLGVAVAALGADHWFVLELRENAAPVVSDAFDRPLDAALLLGAKEAEALASGKAPRGECIDVVGDATLLNRFINFYFAGSALDLRLR